MAFRIFLLCMLISGNAWAHHPTGGEIPDNAFHGLLSGLGHPVIGPDHLAFLLVIGLLCGFHSARVRLWLSGGFVLSTVLGASWHLSELTLPLASPLLAFSLLLAGLVLSRARAMRVVPLAVLASLSGLFHGYAYAESIIGAEMAPIAAYLLGFSLIQLLLINVGAWLAEGMLQRWPQTVQRLMRVLGAAIAVVALGLVGLSLLSS